MKSWEVEPQDRPATSLSYLVLTLFRWEGSEKCIRLKIDILRITETKKKDFSMKYTNMQWSAGGI